MIPAKGAGAGGGDSRPGLGDVARGYDLFLGRPVETLAAAAHQIATTDSLWLLVERLHACGEARHRAIGLALAELRDQHAVAGVTAPPCEADLVGLLAALLADWDARGFGSQHHHLRQTAIRYARRSEKWNVEKGLADGDAEARSILEILGRNGFALADHHDLTIFGDETLRLSRALAPSVRSYLGVEVSAAGVARAARALGGPAPANARSVALRTHLEDSPMSDLFYSVMALHYAPPPVAQTLLRHALRRVRPDGVALFQVASHLHGYRFDLAAYLAGEGRDPQGEIHALSQRTVLQLLAAEGFVILEIIPDPGLAGLGTAYLYVARKRPA